QSFQLFASVSEEPNDPVDPDQGRCRNHPSNHGVVAPVHGVLNGVAQDQEQNQIERRQLADLPFPGYNRTIREQEACTQSFFPLLALAGASFFISTMPVRSKTRRGEL